MKYLDTQPIKIVALQGSVRPDNYTARALSIIKRLASKVPEIDFKIIDPAKLELPLPGKGPRGDAHLLQNTVARADGVILATPEYHGSYSSVMKLMIDNLGFPSVLKDKPVALLGVAAGRIGAIKALEHLRSVASHVGAYVLPGGVSIARVRNAFDENDQLADPDLHELVEGVLMDLIEHVNNTQNAVSQICFYSNN